jgi:hypothetical protein
LFEPVQEALAAPGRRESVSPTVRRAQLISVRFVSASAMFGVVKPGLRIHAVDAEDQHVHIEGSDGSVRYTRRAAWAATRRATR